MPHILLVEDDAMIADAIAARLRAESFTVTAVADGPRAVKLAATERPDLIVLDLMLPGMDGLEVCRRIQADRPVPVIMLTAKDDEVDVLVGLRVGADDYMTKPFSPRELVARVQALLRRVDRDRGLDVDELLVGQVRLDLGRRTATQEGVVTHLTATEFDVLAVLARQRGAVVDRMTLVREVWGYDDPADRTVDSHVKAIRQKLGEDVIRTVRGVGYAAADPAGSAGPAARHPS